MKSLSYLSIYWTLSPKHTHALFSWKWCIRFVWWIQELSVVSSLHSGHCAGAELNTHSFCFKARSSKSVEGKCSLKKKCVYQIKNGKLPKGITANKLLSLEIWVRLLSGGNFEKFLGGIGILGLKNSVGLDIGNGLKEEHFGGNSMNITQFTELIW